MLDCRGFRLCNKWFPNVLDQKMKCEVYQGKKFYLPNFYGKWLKFYGKLRKMSWHNEEIIYPDFGCKYWKKRAYEANI